MRLILNSEPHAVIHVCSPERKGQIMTKEELHQFAVKTLYEEYQLSGVNVILTPSDNSNADLCLMRDDCIINIKVVYSDSFDIDLKDIDTTGLINDFNKFGDIPRITIASSWCFESNDGKPAICGGSFCFKYHNISLIPGEKNEPLPEMLTPMLLAEKYAEAWRRYDADIIEPYLDKDFHYSSTWVFDEMPSRYEYIEYFRGKLKTISKSRPLLKVRPALNNVTGQVGVIIYQNHNTPVIILLTTESGRIISAEMKEFVP